jgi:hypothetical protein
MRVGGEMNDALDTRQPSAVKRMREIVLEQLGADVAAPPRSYESEHVVSVLLQPRNKSAAN